MSFSLVVLGLGLAGCDETSEAAAPPPQQRFQAVTAKQTVEPKELEGFCDIRDAGKLTLPAVEGQPVPTGARWVNVWATWCKSCVEEMPMIDRWKRKLRAKVLFVSADEEPDTLASFQKEHPELPKTARMKDPEELAEWMKTLGLDAGAGLPLHLFVGADDRIRCARAGAVAEHHFDVVEHLLR